MQNQPSRKGKENERKKNKYNERSSIGHNLHSYIIYHADGILDQLMHMYAMLQHSGVCVCACALNMKFGRMRVYARGCVMLIVPSRWCR